ncbi:MAG: copper amine oxidase N-terminal domain-containing protein, partial [Defluviitaleaceae bacterium]|nr:copper amine oxidase N-terminal domain-containing protein [Defluviitaleaceae bacterium]
TPVQVRNLSNAIAISSSGFPSVALGDDGLVWGWGGLGQLGIGTNAPNRTVPAQVRGPGGVGYLDLGVGFTALGEFASSDLGDILTNRNFFQKSSEVSVCEQPPVGNESELLSFHGHNISATTANIAAASTPLTFFSHPMVVILPSTVGTTIANIDVAPRVWGGTPPYTFSGTRFPAGFGISPDGVIFGTPTAHGANTTALITVTDSASPPATAMIRVNIGARTGFPICNHVFNYWTITEPPTCTEPGVETGECQNPDCIRTALRFVAMSEHTWADESAEATCSTDGFDGGACTECLAPNPNVIYALGPDWGDWSETIAPTCIVPGTETRACVRAGCDCPTEVSPATRSIDAPGHAPGAAATCTDPQICVRPDCDAVLAHATGHNWGSGTPATCETPGYSAGDCLTCGALNPAPGAIPPLGHNFGNWQVRAAAQIGVTGEEYRICANCGEEQTRRIPAFPQPPPSSPEPPITRPPAGGDRPDSNPGLPPLPPQAARLTQPAPTPLDTADAPVDTDAPGEYNGDAEEHLRRLMLRIDSYEIIDAATGEIILTMDVAPQIANGRTLVPVRFVSDALGATVAWNEATREVTLTKGDVMLTFAIGETAPGMDAPAQIVDGRTMVPLKFVGEFFGAMVEWDDEARTIEIIKT